MDYKGHASKTYKNQKNHYQQKSIISMCFDKLESIGIKQRHVNRFTLLLTISSAILVVSMIQLKDKLNQLVSSKLDLWIEMMHATDQSNPGYMQYTKFISNNLSKYYIGAKIFVDNFDDVHFNCKFNREDYDKKIKTLNENWKFISNANSNYDKIAHQSIQAVHRVLKKLYELRLMSQSKFNSEEFQKHLLRCEAINAFMDNFEMKQFVNIHLEAMNSAKKFLKNKVTKNN